METQDRDVMANIALVVGALVILAVVIFLVARLMSVIDKNSIKGGESYAEEKQALVAERLQKVGMVKTAAAAPEGAGPVAARSAESVVNGVCASCHGTGVLDAPKLKDAGDWAPRFAQGLPTLVDHAVNGLNAMPPKGGDATLSEEDIRNAVIYMLKDAGQDVADDAAPTAAAEAPAETPVAEAPAAAESTDAANTVVEKATTAVADVAESATDQAEKLVDSAGQAVDAAAGSAAAAVSGMMAAVTGTAAEPAEKAVAAVADAAPAAAEQDFSQGKAMYKQACFSCHDNGVANAPKLGDIEAWAPRIAAGNDAMYHSAIAGKGAMPPKGGRIDVSDEVIRNTVDYMVSLSGG